MSDPVASTADLQAARCEPCEGGVPKMSSAAAREQLTALHVDWSVESDGKTIVRSLNASDFAAAVALLNRIADLAEAEQHHPDLHLTGYRHLKIELTTHAIGGLSRNDFVLAAKIDTIIDESIDAPADA